MKAASKFDDDDDEMLATSLPPLEPVGNSQKYSMTNIIGTSIVALAAILLVFYLGWIGHSVMRPDYSDLIGALKDKGLNILAETIEESGDACFVTPMKKKRFCDLAWGAPDLQDKATEEEQPTNTEKVAQANVRVPQQ